MSASPAQQLWLADSSPLFFYSPSPEYFADTPYASAAWTGLDDGVHGTAGSAAVVLPLIYATAFTPVFATSPSYNTTLQVGTSAPLPWTSNQTWSATSDELTATTFQLSADCLAGQDCASSPFRFQGAWIETLLSPAGATIDSATLDDSSPLITYANFDSSASTTVPVSPTQQDTNSTLSETTLSGAAASLSFQAASIAQYGVTGPSLGSYTVSLDGSVVGTYSARNDVEAHGVLLWFTTNLDANTKHSIVVTAQADGDAQNGDEAGGGGGAAAAAGVGLALDRWEIWGPEGNVGFFTPNGTDTTSGTNGTGNGAGVPGATGSGAPNAGVIVGAILGTLAGLLLLLFLFRKAAPLLAKPPPKQLNAWDEANMLQNMKNEEVHVTTAAKHRYVYPGLIAHGELKR